MAVLAMAGEAIAAVAVVATSAVGVEVARAAAAVAQPSLVQRPTTVVDPLLVLVYGPGHLNNPWLQQQSMLLLPSQQRTVSNARGAAFEP